MAGAGLGDCRASTGALLAQRAGGVEAVPSAVWLRRRQSARALWLGLAATDPIHPPPRCSEEWRPPQWIPSKAEGEDAMLESLGGRIARAMGQG